MMLGIAVHRVKQHAGIDDVQEPVRIRRISSSSSRSPANWRARSRLTVGVPSDSVTVRNWLEAGRADAPARMASLRACLNEILRSLIRWRIRSSASSSNVTVVRILTA